MLLSFGKGPCWRSGAWRSRLSIALCLKTILYKLFRNQKPSMAILALRLSPAHNLDSLERMSKTWAKSTERSAATANGLPELRHCQRSADRETAKMKIRRTKTCDKCSAKLDFGDFNCNSCNEPTPLFNRDVTYVHAALLLVCQTIVVFTIWD